MFFYSFVSYVQSTTVAARRVASLMRFREKRKERCFDKRIRYNVRKEVAQKYGQNSYNYAAQNLSINSIWKSIHNENFKSILDDEKVLSLEDLRYKLKE